MNLDQDYGRDIPDQKRVFDHLCHFVQSQDRETCRRIIVRILPAVVEYVRANPGDPRIKQILRMSRDQGRISQSGGASWKQIGAWSVASIACVMILFHYLALPIHYNYFRTKFDPTSAYNEIKFSFHYFPPHIEMTYETLTLCIDFTHKYWIQNGDKKHYVGLDTVKVLLLEAHQDYPISLEACKKELLENYIVPHDAEYDMEYSTFGTALVINTTIYYKKCLAGWCFHTKNDHGFLVEIEEDALEKYDIQERKDAAEK